MKMIKHIVGIAALCGIGLFCPIQSATTLDVQKIIEKAQTQDYEISSEDATLIRTLIEEKIQTKQPEEMNALQEILAKAKESFEYRGCFSDKKLVMLQTATHSADILSQFVGGLAAGISILMPVAETVDIWKILLAKLYPDSILDGYTASEKKSFLSVPDTEYISVSYKKSNLHTFMLFIAGSVAVAATNFGMHLLLRKITKKLTHLREKRERMFQNRKTIQALLDYILYKQGTLGWNLV